MSDLNKIFVLGIDPGTAYGFALLAPGGGMISLAGGVVPGKARHGAYWYTVWTVMHERIHDAIAKSKSTGLAIAYERSVQRGHAARVFGGWMAMIEASAYDFCIPCVSVHVSAAKITATDKGNATKVEMVIAASRYWPGIDLDDHMADALWIARAAQLGEHDGK